MIFLVLAFTQSHKKYFGKIFNQFFSERDKTLKNPANARVFNSGGVVDSKEIKKNLLQQIKELNLALNTYIYICIT